MIDPITEDPPAEERRGTYRRPVRTIICDQRPGEEFTPDEAATLANCSTNSVRIACTPTGQNRGGKCGGFTFHWKEPARPVTPKKATNPLPEPTSDTQPVRDPQLVARDAEAGLSIAEISRLIHVVVQRRGAALSENEIRSTLTWASQTRSNALLLDRILEGEAPPELPDQAAPVPPRLQLAADPVEPHVTARDRREVARPNGRHGFLGTNGEHV